jgi:hypothetical protein
MFLNFPKIIKFSKIKNVHAKTPFVTTSYFSPLDLVSTNYKDAFAFSSSPVVLAATGF